MTSSNLVLRKYKSNHSFLAETAVFGPGLHFSVLFIVEESLGFLGERGHVEDAFEFHYLSGSCFR